MPDNNTLLVYAAGILIASFMLYSALPYLMAGLTFFVVIFIVAKFQQK